MRVVLFMDPLQAGKGGKYDKQVPIAVEKGGLGSYGMFAMYLDQIQANVVATIYCGSEYFAANQADCISKVGHLLAKVKADVLLCGPCFDFADYAAMSAELGLQIEAQAICPVVLACAQECQETITQYRERLSIVQMPKKGGVGLNQSLKQMAQVVAAVHQGEDRASYQAYLY